MTLKDLSKRLGLSQTTISRALNGYPEVSEDTRRRVIHAAREHGYRPNSQAKRLATGRAMAIGHVIVTSDATSLPPTFAEFMAGAGKIYADRGYDAVISFITKHDAATYQAIHANRSVDGVIVHAPHRLDPRIAMLRDARLPFVVNGRVELSQQAYNWVDIDHAQTSQEATAKLIDLGHREIALVDGQSDLASVLQRRDGYLAAHTVAGLPVHPHFQAIGGDMSEAQGYDAAYEMLSWGQPPTAFVTGSLAAAMGVRRGIMDRGYRLGQDISVYSFDEDSRHMPNGNCVPMFMAMKYPARLAGRKCAALLIDLIENTPFENQHVLLHADRISGPSIGKAPIQLPKAQT
ncbi:hypothetical protein BFP70_14200 [Thioclava sp. SK-1]|nr:hypothetical protein BFP70_14200 [Thioclava sp. SK-1]